MSADRLRRLKALRALREEGARGRLAAANAAARAQETRVDQAIDTARRTEATAEEDGRRAVAEVVARPQAESLQFARLSFAWQMGQEAIHAAYGEAVAANRRLEDLATEATLARRAWAETARQHRKTDLLLKRMGGTAPESGE